MEGTTRTMNCVQLKVSNNYNNTNNRDNNDNTRDTRDIRDNRDDINERNDKDSKDDDTNNENNRNCSESRDIRSDSYIEAKHSDQHMLPLNGGNWRHSRDSDSSHSNDKNDKNNTNNANNTNEINKTKNGNIVNMGNIHELSGFQSEKSTRSPSTDIDAQLTTETRGSSFVADPDNPTGFNLQSALDMIKALGDDESGNYGFVDDYGLGNLANFGEEYGTDLGKEYVDKNSEKSIENDSRKSSMNEKELLEKSFLNSGKSSAQHSTVEEHSIDPKIFEQFNKRILKLMTALGQDDSDSDSEQSTISRNNQANINHESAMRRRTINKQMSRESSKNTSSHSQPVSVKLSDRRGSDNSTSLRSNHTTHSNHSYRSEMIESSLMADDDVSTLQHIGEHTTVKKRRVVGENVSR